MSERGSDHPVDRLSPYLDGVLTDEERDRVARHLEACAACRDHLASLRALGSALAAEAAPPVPDGLAERISAAVAGARVVPLRRRLAVPVTIAATVAAVGLLVAYRWHDSAPAVSPAPAVEASGPEAIRPAPESEREQVSRGLTTLGYIGRTAKEGSAPPASRSAEASKAAKASRAPSAEARALAEELETNEIAAGERRRASAPTTAPEAGVPSRPAAARISDQPSAAAPPPPPPPRHARDTAREAAYAPSPCTGAAKVVEPAATWEVGDMEIALRDLASIAARAGGHGDKTPVASGRPYEITVPKDRFDDLRKRLETRGVAGLPREAPAAPDASCLLVRVSIRVVLGAP